MTQREQSCSYADAAFTVGDIVIANVRNPIENARSRGKRRPFLLVHRVDGHWRGMGLTTSSRYASGAPRVPIPDAAAAGLRGPGFLWGDRLTNVSVLDIDMVIGHVTSALAQAVISTASLDGEDAVRLRGAANSPNAVT